MAAWFARLRCGAAGSELHEAVAERFGPVKLNAGHLIHYDEWLSSPVYAGSRETLKSGMLMQSDVIPSHPVYYSTRMEDGYLIADADLQAQLRALSPGLMDRCVARREFLRNSLGIPAGDEVLPLSNMAGMVPPFLLAPERLLTLAIS